MSKKVILAVFDKDLKVRKYGKFPVSKDGSRILVRKGGKRNFNPTFDNESFIEFPYRSLLSPWKTSYRRVYLVRNGAKACVNFQTETVLDPDPELVIKAAENKILQSIGSEKTETPLILYVLLLIVLAIAGKLFGVIV